MSNVEMIICTPVHAEVLAGLHQACFDQSWETPSFIDLCSMAGSFGFILLIEDEPAGFIVARKAQDEGEIITLGVIPHYRRQGLARTLIRQAEAHLINAGGNTMFLEVADNNYAARKLYEELGYQEAGRRKDYYKTQSGKIDALILQSKLKVI